MRKGRFGVVLCLYPILAFTGVILHQPLLCALFFLLALLAERDEWASRQSLQALALGLVSYGLGRIINGVGSLLPDYTTLHYVFSTVFALVSNLVYLAAIVLSIVAIVRVLKDQEADLPGFSALAYRAFGKQKPRPVFPGQMPPPYTPGQPPYTPGQPPYPPQGPVPPQNGPSGPPPQGGPRA